MSSDAVRDIRLGLGTAAALGFGRFAYGLVLPAMRERLGWSLAGAGGLTTANGIGYLAGAGLAGVLARRWGAGPVFRAGMLLTAVSVAATAGLHGYAALCAMRAASGVGGGLVFVAGGVLAARRAAARGKVLPLTVYYAGAGAGIAISGALLPIPLAARPEWWGWAWIALGVLSALAAAGSWGAAGAGGLPAAAPGGRGRSRWAGTGLRRIAVAYVCFAAGYIAYLTFLSADFAALRLAAWQSAVLWTLLGTGAAVAPVLWSRPLANRPPERMLALLLALLAVSSLVALAGGGGPGAAVPVLAVSVLGFGAGFMSVPVAITGRVREVLPEAAWGRAISALTVLFSVGQILGPWASGALADRTGPWVVIVWTAVLCGLGAVIAVAAGRSSAAP